LPLDRRRGARDDPAVFPPPKPWTQVGEVDSDREYVAFTSRFFLKSPLRLPKWMAQAPPIMKQVDAAPGIVGWSLGMNLPTLEFYTLSAWEYTAVVDYPTPPAAAFAQHVVGLAGRFRFTVGASTFEVGPGDCVAARIDRPTRFEVGDEPAEYLVIVER
jgi:hypothetical protein